MIASVGEIGGVLEETCLFIYDKTCGYWSSGSDIFIVCILCQREIEKEWETESLCSSYVYHAHSLQSQFVEQHHCYRLYRHFDVALLFGAKVMMPVLMIESSTGIMYFFDMY